jgi:integrase
MTAVTQTVTREYLRMPRIKVTQKGLEALAAKRHPARVDYFDIATPGLCLTIGPKSRTWYYFARVDGKLARVKLGEWPAAGIAAARTHAGKIEAQIAAGKHPKAEQARERAEKREARTADQSRLVRNVAAKWRKAHLPGLSKSTQADYLRALAEFEQTHGDDDIGTFRRRTLITWLDGVRERSPSAANRAAVVLRLLFAFALDRFDLEANPARDIKNPSKPKPRKRFLDRREIRILWRACELAGYPYGHALRFGLCTGQRSGEFGGITRRDIDLDGYWIQDENKADRRIDIYLASHALEILDDCPNFGPAAHYFSASGGEAGIHPDRWNKVIPRHIAPLLERAARELKLPPIVKPWTPHDLRRTVRTGMTGWTTVSPDTAERALNHAIGGLRAVYDHADYKPHVADAMRLWDAELSLILAGKKSTRELPREKELAAKPSKRRSRVR